MWISSVLGVKTNWSKANQNCLAVRHDKSLSPDLLVSFCCTVIRSYDSTLKFWISTNISTNDSNSEPLNLYCKWLKFYRTIVRQYDGRKINGLNFIASHVSKMPQIIVWINNRNRERFWLIVQKYSTVFFFYLSNYHFSCFYVRK